MLITHKPNLEAAMRQFAWPVALLIFWDFLIVVTYKLFGWSGGASEHIPLALYGSAIGIVAVFRNNAAYSRWWEARTLWGQIVNNSRSLARQVRTGFGNSRDASAKIREIIELQIAYVRALRQQLRGLDPIEEICDLIDPELVAELRSKSSVPLALQQRIGTVLRSARERDWIDPWEWHSLNRTLCELMHSQGGAERIKNTPMPKQYDLFVMLFVHAYCLLLPIGMVARLGWYTPLGSTLVAVMFLALDRMGRTLENPFANGAHDVPLTAITRTIEINLRQTADDIELPEAVTPVNGVLW